MKTIIMLINQFVNCGPNRVMLNIARNIDKERFKIVAVALRPDNLVRPIASEYIKAGVEVHRFDYSKLELEIFPRKIATQLDDFIGKQNYKNPIIQAHGYHPTIISRHSKIPHTVTMHCIAAEDFIRSKGKLLGYWMVARFIRNLKHHRYPVAISDYMKRYYTDKGVKNITLIHNGVDFKPYEKETESLRQKLNLPSDKYLIVIPGGLHHGKNNIHTINQLHQANKDNFFCVFLGLGPQAQELQNLVAGDSRFRFEGYKANVREYLACADLYISSSLSEGLPMAALEAVCMGIPSLLSDIPPHREIASTLNIDGIETFSVSDNSLCESFKKFINAKFDRSEISKRAILNFSGAAMAKEYERLFEQINLD